MIALDTNVLVRLIVNDDANQVARLRMLLRECGPASPAFVSNIVILELIWVLRFRYKLSRAALCDTLERLLGVDSLHMEHASAVQKAVSFFRSSKADFEDCLIGETGLASGCEYTITLDRDASKLPGMRLLS